MSDSEKSARYKQRPPPISRIADPIPLGLYAFSTTVLILSLYNVRARHVSVPNVVVGPALFYGGLSLLLAGMWEFARANTLAATAFATYGAFLGSYATPLIPGSGVIAAYDDPSMLGSALGIMLMAFMSLSLLFTFASLQHSIAFVLFAALALTFLFLGVAEFTGSSGLTKAGGYFGLTAAGAGYYIGTTLLFAYCGVINLPLGLIKHAA